MLLPFVARGVCVYAGAAWSRVCVLLGGEDPELLTRDITLEKKKKTGKKKKNGPGCRSYSSESVEFFEIIWCKSLIKSVP